jgi:hypothetical protein
MRGDGIALSCQTCQFAACPQFSSVERDCHEAPGHLHKVRERFLLLSCFIVVGSFSAAANPIISEFLADNESVQSDQDGDFKDWREIFNPDSDPVDLSGYFLTDNSTNLDKWVIPVTTMLGSNDFLLIFASGKDRAVAGQELHTNFRIDNSGEYLALVAPDGVTIVTEFAPTFGRYIVRL